MFTVKQEISILNFDAWQGALSTKNKIIELGLVDKFDSWIESVYPDGITSTELNDLLWFDPDSIFENIM